MEGLGEETITTFRQALERVSAVAHAKLPAELHGNLERAHALIVHRHVWMDDDGKHAQVLSSDGTTWYLVNGNCTCMGVAHAPQALCKHRLAVGLYRRAGELLATSGGTPTPAPPAPPACPEALFSACLKGTVGGIDTQLTARGMTLEEFRANFAAVHALFDAPTARPQGEASALAQTQGTPTCPHHGPGKESTKAPGTWYCTKRMADQSYCTWRHPTK